MKRMSYEEIAAKRAQDDMRILDVREQDEYNEVRVKDVELFPLSRLQRGELPEADSREVAVICRSGGRSQRACEILEEAGWPECINVEGGTLAAIDLSEDEVERGYINQ
jgi:rhodanese-related sulfurtransferase